MASFVPDSQTDAFGDARSRCAHGSLPREVLAPVVAGAFARGIAETLTMLGVPSVFLDNKGRVLFVNEAARPFLAGPLRMRSHHLLADERGDNLNLAGLIAKALSDPVHNHSARLGQAALTLHVMPPPGGSTMVGQLLQAILLIDDERQPGISECVRRLKAA